MKKQILSVVSMFVAAMTFTACDKADNPSTPDVKVPTVAGIPSDNGVMPNPVINASDINTALPNLNYTVDTENGWAVIRLDMTGVQDPFTKDWVKLYGPGSGKQNVWVSVDNVPKGFSIKNTIDEIGEQSDPAVDVVFLVDNSGSMDQEADALARDIISWSAKLSQTLDIRFACVGYSVSGTINGGIDFTTAESLENYLNRYRGTSRTMDFGGANAGELKAAANEININRVRDECGVMALHYADETFNFRLGANRIYVNFTDEPNQPAQKEEYSTEWVKDTNNWPVTKGTIHTVYSDSHNWSQTIGTKEWPWNLSEYTGGTTLFTNRSFSGVSLDDLPVTGALRNSYIIRFTNVEGVFDGQSHVVHITVKSSSPNGEILADKEFELTFAKE